VLAAVQSDETFLDWIWAVLFYGGCSVVLLIDQGKQLLG